MYLFINLFHAAISSKKYINTTRQKLNKGLRKYLKTGPLLKGHSYKEVTEKKLDYARLFLLILDFYCCYLKKYSAGEMEKKFTLEKEFNKFQFFIKVPLPKLKPFAGVVQWLAHRLYVTFSKNFQ